MFVFLVVFLLVIGLDFVFDLQLLVGFAGRIVIWGFWGICLVLWDSSGLIGFDGEFCGRVVS